jgi:molecular chaperone GrpE
VEENTENAKEEYREKLLRLQADYDNYRKNFEKRFEEQRKLANERLVRELLTVMDDFERMMKSTDDEETRGGMEMVYRNMMKALKNEGVERMECVGKPFDPFEQEAIEVSYEGSCEENTVMEELRAGYRMNGRVIRTAQVKVKGGKK